MQMWLIPGQPPRVMQGIGRSIDIAPTLLDLAGVSRPGLDGESMLSQFAAGAFQERDRYAENQLGGCVSMVRADGWKVISTGMVSSSRPPEHAPEHHWLAAFDLRSDPMEQVNLVGTPQGAEALEWALERHHQLEATRVEPFVPA
jgi:arylsulfatase A-like enzyme